MIKSVIAGNQTCANCGALIKSGDTCYILEVAPKNEKIVCSVTCGNLYLVGEYDDGS